jgi:hypothetical protein
MDMDMHMSYVYVYVYVYVYMIRAAICTTKWYTLTFHKMTILYLENWVRATIHDHLWVPNLTIL